MNPQHAQRSPDSGTQQQKLPPATCSTAAKRQAPEAQTAPAGIRAPTRLGQAVELVLMA
ncbi:hypothetical protein [Aureliella helgolandensis]|uniref:hypothetical protein n=1 Tax=Aureliella helgolandensis TaxID=2527968 RepID=UPI0018CFFA55|nr:hypothetical protein [Aureliella helgolandensis]